MNMVSHATSAEADGFIASEPRTFNEWAKLLRDGQSPTELVDHIAFMQYDEKLSAEARWPRLEEVFTETHQFIGAAICPSCCEEFELYMVDGKEQMIEFFGNGTCTNHSLFEQHLEEWDIAHPI